MTLLPADIEAERLCLSAALLGEAPSDLQPWHFFDSRHRLIFENLQPTATDTFLAINATRGQQPGLSAYLAELITLWPDSLAEHHEAELEHAATTVIAWARRRRLAHAAERLVARLRTGKLEPEEAWATLKSECAA